MGSRGTFPPKILIYRHRRTGQRGEVGLQPPPNFGKLRFFGEQEQIGAKPVFKDISMFILLFF